MQSLINKYSTMRRLLHLTFLCLLLSGATMAQNKFWVAPGASGNWSTAANWSLTSGGAGGAGAPTAAQNAVFDGGSTASCNMNTLAIFVNNITVNAAYTGTISQPAATSVLVTTGNVTIGGGTVSMPGTLVFNGNFDQTGGTVSVGTSITSTAILGTSTLTGGTFNIGGPIQFDGNLNITSPGVTINPGTSPVTFNGSVNRTLNINGGAPGSVSFYDVILDKSNVGGQNLNIAGTDQLIVLHDLTLSNGSLGTGTGTVQVAGNLFIDNGFTGGLVDLILNGAGNSTVTVNAPFTTGGAGITTINKSNPAATVSFVTDLPSNIVDLSTVANSTFNVTSGTVNYPDNDAVNMIFNTFNIGSAGTYTASSNTTTFQGNLNIDGTFNANGGTVNLAAAAARTIAVQGAATNATVTFNNIILNNTSAAGNLNIQAGDQVVATGNVTITDGRFNGGTIQINGNLTTGAASDATSAATALIFGGSGNSIVTLNAAATGNWNGPVTINKSGGNVTLASPFILDQNGQLITFTSGVLNTSATNYLHLIGNNVNWAGAGNSSYVDGFIRRTGTSAFTFPTGNSGFFAPLHIAGTTAFNGAMPNNPTTGNPPTYQAQYIRSNPQVPFPNTNNPPTDGNTPPTLLTLSQQEYYIFDFVSDVPGFPPTDYASANMPFLWMSYENLRSGGIAQPTSVAVVAWLTNRWENLSNGGLTNVGGIDYLRSNVRAFSAADNNPVFSFGTNNPILNPLPVEWLDFTGRKAGSTVELSWTTSSEKNNESFTVERSGNGTTFTAIGTVAGNGTTNLTSYYTFTDKAPLAGISVYRIKQTDDNGKYSYSPQIRISASGVALAGLRLYPNPVNASIPTYLENSSWRNQKVELSIISAIGTVVRKEQISFGGDSRAKINVSGLQKGTYFISTQVNGEKNVVPFVIQ